MTQRAGRMLMGLGMAVWTSPVYAYGSEAQLGSFLDQAAQWLVTILGPGIFTIGVIMVGISLAFGDQDALRKGGYVMAGGVLIFLSQGVVSLLRRLAGGF